MIYALGTWWKQASEFLRDGLVFNATVFLHSKRAAHKFVATARGGASISLVSLHLHAQRSILTVQHYNRSEQYCGDLRLSANIKRLRNRTDDLCLEEDSYLFLGNAGSVLISYLSVTPRINWQTYARNNAPVLALGPFWRKTRRWLPPTRLSQHVPMSGLP